MPRQKYRKVETSCSESESDTEIFERDDHEEPLRRKVVQLPRSAVIFSDSLLRLCNTQFKSCKLIQFHNIHGGANLEKILVDIKTFQQHNLADGPFIYVICGGSNDCFPRCDRTKSLPPSTEEEIEVFFANKQQEIGSAIDSIERTVQSSGKSDIILWCTVPPRLNINQAEESVFGWINKTFIQSNTSLNLPTPELHRVIARYRNKKGVAVYSETRASRLLGDGVHPTQETANKWATEIIHVIEKILQRN